MLVTEPVENPEPDEDKASNEALRLEQESNTCALPRAPPPQNTVVLCSLPG